MAFCPHCGTQILANTKFCYKCGSKVAGVTDDVSEQVAIEKSSVSPEGYNQAKTPATFAVTGFILSVLSVVSFIISAVLLEFYLILMEEIASSDFVVFAIILAAPCITGVVFSAMAIKKRQRKRGLAIAGVIVGSVMAVYNLLILLTAALLIVV